MENEFLDLGLMSPEKQKTMFGGALAKQEETNPSADGQSEEPENKETEEPDKNDQGNVGNDGDDNKRQEGTSEKEGSPNYITSITQAFKGSAFRTLDDDRLSKVKSVEELEKAFEEEVNNRATEQEKRVKEALNYKVPVSDIQQYEGMIESLNNISEDQLRDDSDPEMESLRRDLIFRANMIATNNKAKAEKMTQRSFATGNDIDDAIDAVQDCLSYYQKSYKNLIEESKKSQEKYVESQKKLVSDIESAIMNDKDVFDKFEVNDVMRKKIFENISAPAYTDEDGNQMTALQKYIVDNPVESNKIIGMLFTLSDGFKNFDGIFKGKANKAANNAIKNLDKILSKAAISKDGSMQLTGGVNEKSYTVDLTKPLSLG